MSARSVIEHALRAYYADSAEPNGVARDLLAGHRAEVLAEAKAEVIAWLAKKAGEGTPAVDLASKVDRGAIRLFLTTEEKTTPSTKGAAVTPELDAWQSEDEQRRELLLAEIRTHGGKWTKRRAINFYREHGAEGALKSRAKRDLHALYVLGALSLNGPQDGRFYLLRKGGA